MASDSLGVQLDFLVADAIRGGEQCHCRDRRRRLNLARQLQSVGQRLPRQTWVVGDHAQTPIADRLGRDGEQKNALSTPPE
jgi:thymidine phosphorylase